MSVGSQSSEVSIKSFWSNGNVKYPFGKHEESAAVFRNNLCSKIVSIKASCKGLLYVSWKSAEKEFYTVFESDSQLEVIFKS